MSGRILAIETSCDETAVAVVDNGRRIVANVVASQVALHAATGGIVPEVAARAHLRWMIPVLEQAREQAGITDWSELEAIAVTEGPGLAGSLLVGITMAKTLAWVHDLPLVPVNHLEGHIYAAWLLDPDEEDKPAPEFPVVALVVSGGHTFLVEMKDSLLVPTARPDRRRRGGGGVRQGRPAARAAVSGRPGDHEGRGRQRRSRDRVFPRAWLGDTFDFSLQRPEDRRAARGRAKELGTDVNAMSSDAQAPARRRGQPSWPTASRTRSSTC